MLVMLCVTAYNAKAQDTFYGEIGLTGGGGFVLGVVIIVVSIMASVAIVERKDM